MPAEDRTGSAHQGPLSLPQPPAITRPKGGGAIRGVDEKFSVNPATDTARLSVPIFTSPGRLSPDLALSCDSGQGNAPFGAGWNLGVPSISRKTSKGLPRYRDDEDTFILSGIEDLVPALVNQGGDWQEPNLRWIDLTGDRHADRLITQDDVSPALSPDEVAPAGGGDPFSRGWDAEFKLFGHTLFQTERTATGELYLGALRRCAPVVSGICGGSARRHRACTSLTGSIHVFLVGQARGQQ